MSPLQPPLRSAVLAGSVLLLSACGTLAPAPQPTRERSVESTAPTAAAMPVLPPSGELPADAVPRAEPRSRYGNPVSYEVFGQRYFVMADARGHREQGTASWYGPGFHGQRTSSGEPYDMYQMTAAHKTLPIPAYVRVENLNNGRSIVVRVNDRGPFVGDRIIDLSYVAAARLDMLRAGTAPVAITVLEPLRPPGEGSEYVPPVQNVTTQTTLASVLTSGFVQAGAFSSQANADSLRQKLSASGFSQLEIQPIAGNSGQTLYRLRIGPVTSAAEADDLIERLALAGVPDARLVTP